jgi:hypothetical protein
MLRPTEAKAEGKEGGDGLKAAPIGATTKAKEERADGPLDYAQRKSPPLKREKKSGGTA